MANLIDRYMGFFRDEDVEAEAAAMAEVREAAAWLGQPYQKKFIKWLNEQSSKPLDTSVDHATLIKAVTRVETFKEVEKHLSKLDAEVKNALQQYREGE